MQRPLWNRFAGLCALTLVVVATGGSIQADKDDTTKDSPGTGEEAALSQEAEGVAALATAYDLAAYGRSNAMPEALVTAALIIAKVGKGEELKDQPEGSADIKTAANEAADLVKEAKELAETKGQKALVAEAEANLKGTGRALLAGGLTWKGRVKRSQNQTVGATYKAGQPVAITVHALSASPLPAKKVPSKTAGKTAARVVVRPVHPILRLEVIQGTSTVVAHGQGPVAVARFTPRTGGAYRLRVTNLGSGEVAYQGHTSK